MLNKIFVTTFNYSLFQNYAHKLVDSFIKTNQDILLYCYVEDDVNLYPKYENITYLNLFIEQPLSLKFVERNKLKSQNNSSRNNKQPPKKNNRKWLPW